MKERKIAKLGHTQNITYTEAKRVVETTKCGSDKKNIPTTKNKAVICVKQVQPQNLR